MGLVAVGSSRSRRARFPQGFPAFLKPCAGVVYGDSYRIVLGKVIEVWSREGRGVTFYELYSKERVLRSKNGLKRVLDTLTRCGYLVCSEGRASRGSPLGRKDYYPTPLGIVMNTVLTLLHPEELGVEGEEVVYPLAWYHVSETLFVRLPDIYGYMVSAVREGLVGTSREELRRGFLATLHAMNLLFLEATEAEDYIGGPVVPPYSSRELLKLLGNQLREDVDYLERVRKGVREGSIHGRVLDHLQNSYRLLAKALEVHDVGGSSTHVSSPMN
ncbi:MAG: hypothetical protein LM564_03340 [Desulfurococcaceae archaeon]|nr:hypothetical protein [Desulfurococcaceae archaeon]